MDPIINLSSLTLCARPGYPVPVLWPLFKLPGALEVMLPFLVHAAKIHSTFAVSPFKKLFVTVTRL